MFGSSGFRKFQFLQPTGISVESLHEHPMKNPLLSRKSKSCLSVSNPTVEFTTSDKEVIVHLLVVQELEQFKQFQEKLVEAIVHQM
ncbi:hypothetical protein SUGI_0898240 [Cryptomeria japonica]|nr:hypothetical protein SUGI_0898240 [Cryptomeria japonica]